MFPVIKNPSSIFLLKFFVKESFSFLLICRLKIDFFFLNSRLYDKTLKLFFVVILKIDFLNFFSNGEWFCSLKI